MHPQFKPCPQRGLSYWLYLGGNGEAQDMVILPQDLDVSMIRKWEKSNGCSFPAFNIQPLYEPNETEKEIIKNLKKALTKGNQLIVDDLNNIISNSKSLWSAAIQKKINDCLRRATIEVEEQIGDAPEEFMAISELIRRARCLSAESLYTQLTDICIKKLTDKQTARPELIDVLFFYTGKSPKNFQVILELPDWSNIGAEYPANHRIVQQWMNNRFLDFSAENRNAELNETDAFGENAVGKEEKFPPVHMKNSLGNVILRAMNKESPCQMRYGMIDAESFPAGNDVRMSMKGALEWLSDPERKGKTWADLSRKTDRPTLLFAYPTEMPQQEPELAGLCGIAEGDSAAPDGATFAAIAARVIQALRGRTDGHPDNDIRIFVLTKMDTARTKVMVSRRYTVDHVIAAAEDWQRGCLNTPSIKIRQFGPAKGDKPIWAEPLIPFPAEVMWCLNTAWRRMGSYAEQVHGFSINDGISLLLDEGFVLTNIANRALVAAVENCSPLLLALGQEHAFGKVFEFDRKAKRLGKQVLLLPSIIGLLLHKINFKKGGFMNSPAFWVGRLLRLADRLHMKYCEYVRKNSFPPQLIGNALMVMALEQPVKALELLSQRILPYQAWAVTLKGEGQGIGLVKYFLAQIGEVCNNLKNLELPAQCSPAEKAQMLLGYLAWQEKGNQ
jgi:hypothetical protein